MVGVLSSSDLVRTLYPKDFGGGILVLCCIFQCADKYTVPQHNHHCTGVFIVTLKNLIPLISFYKVWIRHIILFIV